MFSHQYTFLNSMRFEKSIQLLLDYISHRYTNMDILSALVVAFQLSGLVISTKVFGDESGNLVESVKTLQVDFAAGFVQEYNK